MERLHTRTAVDAAPGADYIAHRIPAVPNAVDSVDVEALPIELDTPWRHRKQT